MRLRNVIIGLVALVLVVVGVLVAVLAGGVDKYRPKVQAELQKNLNRNVTIGHLGLSLFPLALRADGVTVAESPEFPSTQPFATASKLYVSAGLFSLLSGNPEVKVLTLDKPQIELVKNAAGVWNFSTIGESGTAKQQGSGGKSSQMALDELKISDGQVAVTDLVAHQPRSVYDHIDLKLTDLRPGTPSNIDLAVHFPGQGKEELAFKGKAGPIQGTDTNSMPVNGHLSLQDVSLAAVNRFAPGTLPPQTDGIATGDADINSQATAITAKGDLKLRDAVLRGAKLNFPMSARYDLTDERAQNKLQIRTGNLDLGSTSFKITGEVDTGTKPANLNVQLNTDNSSITDLARLAGAFGVAFNPAYQIKGFVSANISARGPATSPQLNGSLTAKQVEASGGEIKQPVSVPEIALNFTPDVIHANSFTATSGSSSLTIAATVAHYTTPGKTVDGTLSTTNANIAELLNMAKAYGVDAAKGATATGKLSANIHVQGPVADSSKLSYAGNGTISGATITTPELTKPVSVASANATFSQNSVSITNLAASVGSTGVRGNLAARNFAAPNLQFALAADKIDTAELQTLTPKSTAAHPATPGHPAQPAEPSLLNRTTGSGTLAANTIKAEEITLTNVRANCKLDRGVITLSPLSADIFGGKENGTLTLDARGVNTGVGINAKFVGVDTNALLSAVSSAKDTLYGRLEANTNLRFMLASSADLARTLNGTLGFNVTNGQLKNVNILNELSKVGKFLGSAPAQSGSGTALRKFTGTLNIVNGVANTNNLVANLDAGSLSATGMLNLVNQALDLHMNAVLASGTSQQVGGTQVGGFLNTALANNKGELVIPVNVTGTMAHPIFTPDVQALAKMKMNNLLPSVTDPSRLASGILGARGGGAGGIVNGLLGGAAPAQGAAKSQQQQKPEDTVNSLLQQFGKKKKPQ
jgi:uncharacterized protein involved in outer membrane biogenesis